MSPPNKHTIRPKRRSESPKEHLLRTLLGAKGIATRSKDATRGSWPYYWEQEATSNKCIATSNKCLTSSNKDASSNNVRY